MHRRCLETKIDNRRIWMSAKCFDMGGQYFRRFLLDRSGDGDGNAIKYNSARAADGFLVQVLPTRCDDFLA